MTPIQDNIKEFIKTNSVATICVSDSKNAPHCFSCFYEFIEDTNLLVFKSSYGTQHEIEVQTVSTISGTVLPDQLDALKIRGIQFNGSTISKNEITATITAAYYKKYPLGLVMVGYVWAIQLEYIKFTDNTLIFSQKTIWAK